MADDRTFVIVGASLAGAKAAEQLRTDGFTGRIVLVGAETDRPYERPPLSKGYLLGKEPRDKAFVHDAAVVRRARRRAGARGDRDRPGPEGAHGHPRQRRAAALRQAAAGHRVPGARSSTSPASRTPASTTCAPSTQSETLRDGLREGAQVVVVGAGWIGLETAAAAREHGATVTVVEMDSLPLRRVLGDEVADVLPRRAHRPRRDVPLRSRACASSAAPAAGSPTPCSPTAPRCRPTWSSSGSASPPTSSWPRRPGWTSDNGVVTDEHLRTSDPDIYAAGDVASFLHPMLGKRIRVEHWANALHGGRAAGSAMLGGDAPYDRVPYFFSDQYTSDPSIGMEYAGYVEPGGYDQVVFRGDPAGARVHRLLDPAGPGAGRHERQRLGRAGRHPGPGPGRLRRRVRRPRPAGRPARCR